MIDFDAAILEAAGEPVRFKLGGTDFTVPTPLPAGAFLKMLSAETGSALTLHVDFIREIVSPDEREALDEAITRSRISSVLLINLAEQLVEAVSGNPTKPPKQSRRRPSSTGASAKAAV